jgi:hypothetical protein
MSGFELVAVVIAAFFIAGIAVGLLAVIAISRLGHGRPDRKYMSGGGWQEPPLLREDDKPPRWPGR